MKQIVALCVSVLMTVGASANVQFIDGTKIGTDSQVESALTYLKDNQQYYDHWSNEWHYDTPKQVYIDKLRHTYALFASMATKNVELDLVLGDISQYLYNLDDTAFYRKAVSHYQAAIDAHPNDYRGYWFLGHHYALSNAPTLAMEHFTKAQELLPTDQPYEFWEDYAWASAVTNMPSHCIFAMDKVKRILGKEGSVEAQLGKTIRNRIEPVDRTKSYKKESIWTAAQGDKIEFTCRPLGIKIRIDPTWNASVYDYDNGQCACIINPPALKSKKGKEINYTLAILMKAASANDNLESYLNVLLSKDLRKTKIPFSDKYDAMVAYEIIDKTIYPDMGGGHLYLIGIERNAPDYPGLLLESPVTLPQGSAGQISYYRPSNSKDRFKGKLFYAIMLDSCEDINEPSLAVLRTLFTEQLIIE
jgi:tetratricopeptide (TPR) repeat protein